MLSRVIDSAGAFPMWGGGGLEGVWLIGRGWFWLL